jgi:transcriptional regulator with XRE-family HTH domain
MDDLTMQTSRELGARLRQTRMRRGYNHRAVAQLAGMSERAWVELEVGIRARWASLLLPDLIRVCDAVNSHPAVLFLGL